MEKNNSNLLRFYDYCAAILAGTLTAFFVSLTIGSDWPMIVGMIVGMLLGMVAIGIAIMVFVRVGGIFEIIMPGMLIAMGVGMVGGMWVIGGSPFRGELISFGFLTGLYTQALFHLYDRSLHGELPCEEK